MANMTEDCNKTEKKNKRGNREREKKQKPKGTLALLLPLPKCAETGDTFFDFFVYFLKKYSALFSFRSQLRQKPQPNHEHFVSSPPPTTTKNRLAFGSSSSFFLVLGLVSEFYDNPERGKSIESWL